MKDIFIGRVADVLDLDTVDVEVTQVVRSNNDTYRPKESVRLKTLQDGLHPIRGIKNIKYIEALLKGKGVMCLVIDRDARSRIEADVYTLGK